MDASTSCDGVKQSETAGPSEIILTNWKPADVFAVALLDIIFYLGALGRFTFSLGQFFVFPPSSFQFQE